MSYRTRVGEPPPILPATTYGQAPQIPRAPKLPADRSMTASNRLSLTSNSSAGRRSSASLDGPSVRPSGIPRPTKPSSSTRPNASASLRSTAPIVYRPKAPANFTGVATRTTLHHAMPRMTTSNTAPRIVNEDDMMSLEPTAPAFDVDHDTVLGIAMPTKQLQHSTNLPPRLIPELQALAAASQRRPTPAMSTISTISSPSTQFTTSPSPWSASTTTTTPTSWSSTSPSLVKPVRTQPLTKRSHTVPMQSVARTTMPKLPVLRESAASSAASSKINIPSEEARTPQRTKKKTPLNSPAPTPPPRTSSVKRTRSKSNSNNEDPSVTHSASAPPLIRKQDVSPTVKHVEEVASRQNRPSHVQSWVDHHNKLQNAINFMPMQHHYQDAHNDVEVRKQPDLNENHIRHNEQVQALLDAAPIETFPQADSKLSLQLTRSKSVEQEPSTPATPRSRLAKFSRLALFGRSSKNTTADSEASQQPRKLQRRGPAAGTGHEGYSKFRRKERKTSSDGNTTGTESETSVVSTRPSISRSTSKQDGSSKSRGNRSSQSDLDDFAASRLKPVVMLGGSQTAGGIQYRDLSNTSAPSNVKPPAHVWNHHETREILGETQQVRHPSVTSSGPLLRESRLIFHLNSLDDHDPLQLTTRPLQEFDPANNSRPPQPVNTSVPFNPPYLSSYNTSRSSIVPASVAPTDTSSELLRVDSQPTEAKRKKGRRLNWGFFKKKEFIPETYQPRVSSRTATPRMAVRVSTVPPPRPLPYYAMLESENEINSADAINKYFTEATRAVSMDEDDEPTPRVQNTETTSLVRNESVLLPAAPKLRRKKDLMEVDDPSKIKIQPKLEVQTSFETPAKPRQPRLAQVGRIPKVVPTTQAKPPAPISTVSVVEATKPSKPNHTSNIRTKPVESVPLTINTDFVSGISLKHTNSPKAAKIPLRSALDYITPSTHAHSHDMMRILDRYSTTSSSSDGVLSVMGPPLLPAPEFPLRNFRYTTTEDDVWNEYDDFIDHVISSPRLKKSTTRISDENKLQSLSTRKYNLAPENRRLDRKPPKSLVVETSFTPAPVLYHSPAPLGDYDIDQDFRLRRSRIISALHSSLDPSSPFSIGDYLTEIGEHQRNSAKTLERLSDSSMDPNDPNSSQTLLAFPEPPVSQREHKHYENTVHMDELERSKNPARHSERSYASLMVSRWLSFGRVLFSPAHAGLQKQPERHVLVIDGLGNEDWSMYCAVTYQTEQAYIYDLKETGHSRSSTSTKKAGITPQNFRRRELASFNEAFKFPDKFFSVIVLRFPPVMSESKLRNIVSECRRVLAPGGYMELMLLDLDIVNMGVVTRRAMRELKTKIATCNREVSLKPVIDNIQSVLGEKGFSKLSKCVVGVPVVGQPPGAESPTSSRSSAGSDKLRKSPSAGPRPLEGLETRHHHNFSLNDLIADHSDNADAKIGRVVSRTARSWWQHCFEAVVISDGNLAKSILADKQVLEECKSRGSSFKLLIAYAQVPGIPSVGVKRRTMSEPVVATLATAGTP